MSKNVKQENKAELLARKLAKALYDELEEDSWGAIEPEWILQAADGHATLYEAITEKVGAHPSGYSFSVESAENAESFLNALERAIKKLKLDEN